MTTRRFQTPRGRWITVQQYLSLQDAAARRNHDTPPCEHGHFGCAVWDGGPCTDELSREVGTKEEENQ